MDSRRAAETAFLEVELRPYEGWTPKVKHQSYFSAAIRGGRAFATLVLSFRHLEKSAECVGCEGWKEHWMM